MPNPARHRNLARRAGRLACTLLLLGAAAAPAQAINLFGIYVDGEFGEGQVRSDAGNISAGAFRQNHSAYQAGFGIKPVPLLGAEVQYIDLGHPTGNLGGQPADVSVKGTAAFGLLYLPLPIPLVDVYAKAGFAHLQSAVNGQVIVPGQGTCTVGGPGCAFQPFHLTRGDSKFAGGFGAQLKLGDLAIRGEYERFETTGGNPGLFALGLAWTFF